MKLKYNLVGERYGRLLVVERAENINQRVRWICKCDCGNSVIVSAHSLRGGDTKSCGCLKKEQDKKNLTPPTHRKTNTRLYNIYHNMKQRCYNSKNTGYYRYGARGIKICDEWKNSFESFYNWAINNGYSDNLSIDRINNNGNYEPSNCRWGDMEIQSNNTEKTHHYIYNGECLTISQLAKKYNIKRKLLSRRLCEDKWNIQEAITTPKFKHHIQTT